MIVHALYLATRHLAASPARASVLVLCTSVALFLPLFTARTAALVEDALLARAAASPVLVGAKGDPFDLTLATLYFRSRVDDPVPLGERNRLAEYGRVLPLHVGHTASGSPVVGTTLAYFDARQLNVALGRKFAVLGEVVAGAKAAERFRLGPGARLRTDLANVYNLSGAYPYVLEVVGVLESTGTDDDEAFFVDLKTTWVLDGTVHGHTAVTAEQAVDTDGEQDGNLEASAAIFLAQEITAETRASFHLHGDPEALPVTGFVVLPDDVRRHDQLLGAMALDDDLAAVRPVEVVRSVLGIVLRVQEGLHLAFALVAAATTGFFLLVLSLTLRLRDAELQLLRRLGCSRNAVAWIVAAEISIITLTAATVAGASAWVAASQVALTLQ